VRQGKHTLRFADASLDREVGATLVTEGGGKGWMVYPWPSGAGRARSHCRFVLPLMHFIPDSLTYSVTLFLKRQCDRTLGAGCEHGCTGSLMYAVGPGVAAPAPLLLLAHTLALYLLAYHFQPSHTPHSEFCPNPGKHCFYENGTRDNGTGPPIPGRAYCPGCGAPSYGSDGACPCTGRHTCPDVPLDAGSNLSFTPDPAPVPPPPLRRTDRAPSSLRATSAPACPVAP
jgi:hypothetical protein